MRIKRLDGPPHIVNREIENLGDYVHESLGGVGELLRGGIFVADGGEEVQQTAALNDRDIRRQKS